MLVSGTIQVAAGNILELVAEGHNALLGPNVTFMQFQVHMHTFDLMRGTVSSTWGNGSV